MLNKEETKKLLKDFVWECYEFWANELNTDDDKEIWLKAINDLQRINHSSFSPQGEHLDQDVKMEFINQLKKDLGI